MTGILIGAAVALLVGALVSAIGVYLYFVATGDFDATGMKAVEDEEDHR